MRRMGAASLIVVIATACTAQEAEPPPRDAIASVDPSTAEPSETPTPVETVDPTARCEGLGRSPRVGQITLFENNQLRAFTPKGAGPTCLVLSDGALRMGNVNPPLWNATGDWVIVDDRALSRDGSITTRLTEKRLEVPIWSRPTGSSVMWLTGDGRLMKRSSLGGKAADISFLARHDDVTYHPAGTHIATSGLENDGDYGLFLATNLGTDSTLIARGEAARFISHLQFTEDGRSLLYDARHAPRNWHLHRLSIGKDPVLETLDKGTGPYEYVVSPFNPFEVAWFESGDCAAGEPGTFTREYRRKFQIPRSFQEQNIHPVGWATPRKLVVRVATTGCGTAQPGDVYVLSESRAPVLIDRENYGNVSIRVRMPSPPPPPGEEQEVVA